MFELSQSKNQIIIKRNTTFLGIGVVTIIMASAGIRLVFGLLPFEENYTFAENCVVTVNGKPVEVERAETGRYVHFIYNFGSIENNVDNPISFLEIIEGYIKEFFKKIYKFVAALFGHTIY